MRTFWIYTPNGWQTYADMTKCGFLDAPKIGEYNIDTAGTLHLWVSEGYMQTTMWHSLGVWTPK